LKVANPRARDPWRENAEAAPADDSVSFHPPASIPSHDESPALADDCRVRSKKQPLAILKDVSATRGQREVLSVRAQNVLKELAVELTGKCPPKGTWVPPDDALRELSYNHLRLARNCGPQTADEIIRWAQSRGVTIERPLHDGKSLSATWRDIVARFSTAEFTRVEIVEALERSIRRKNTRIPVAFQDMLVKLLNGSGR